jgi:hypothetical protein
VRRPGFALPDGWIACGWRFEVETISPQQRSLIQQHFGARRFAYNWAVATVKANLDARAADPSVPLLAWTLPTLRKAWNQAKVTVAPWWPSCSVAGGQARVLSMTLSEHAGRLFVSVASIVVLVARSPREPHARCGIDLGVGTEWAVITHADGTVERIPHPVQWASAQNQHRRLARRASRRTVGSRGHRQAKTQAGSPRPAGGQPASRVHSHSHHQADAPVRHDRRRGSGHRRNGPRHGATSVQTQRACSRTRSDSPNHGIQERLGRLRASGGRPLVRFLQDPPRVRRLSRRPQARRPPMGMPQMRRLGGPQRKCGPQHP